MPRAEVVPLPPQVRGTLTLSVDLEDWHQLVTRRFSGRLPECSTNVEQQTSTVLDVLDAHGVKGTFFVLGMVAEARPDLVRAVAARGHEIASHGISHVSLHRLDRAVIRAELADSRKRLADLAGADVVGFRAPEFSITAKNAFILEEIAAAGYRYDSSIYPIVHRRYGIKGFSRAPVRLMTAEGPLWELPLATLPTPLGNVPIAGGGYFRLFPGLALETALGSLTRRGEHAMLYFHPYEFTTRPLELDRDALPSPARERAQAAIWLTLQRIGRNRLPGRAERALQVAPSIRAVDLVAALDAEAERGHERPSVSSPSTSPSRSSLDDVRHH